MLHAHDRPIEPSLLAFRGARESTAQLLDRMTDEDWRRHGWHSGRRVPRRAVARSGTRRTPTTTPTRSAACARRSAHERSGAWRCRDRALDLTARTAVARIVNVTPDSFSDGGRFLDPAAAIARCRELAAEGADLLDLGAESTRPARPRSRRTSRCAGSSRAARAAGRARAPAGRRGHGGRVVDTRDAAVAGALELGAHVINDVSALDDPDMGAVVAAAGAGLVLMHMRGTPETMRERARTPTSSPRSPRSCARHARAEAAGVARDRIALDPGIGFAKSAEHSLELLASTAELAALGPLLVGASRKSFLTRLGAGANAGERLEGSLAAAALAVFEGARIVRVHDVAATVRAVRVAEGAGARAARGEAQRARGATLPA